MPGRVLRMVESALGAESPPEPAPVPPVESTPLPAPFASFLDTYTALLPAEMPSAPSQKETGTVAEQP